MALPQQLLGSTGRLVTRLGLGGEGVLRTHGRHAGAHDVIARAVHHGITYFDSARAYAGSEEYHGRFWSKHPEWRSHAFVTSKSPARDAAGAWADLETTLATMKTTYLDLWQIHDVREIDEVDELRAPGGALEAFWAAKQQGRVRHIGVTGHHDPAVLLHAVRTLPVDTVLMPVSVIEAAIGGFMTDVLREARGRGMGVIGMKVLGQKTFLDAAPGLDATQLIRFALAQSVDAIIVGCTTPDEVDQNAAAALSSPMPPSEQIALVESVRDVARALAYYRRDEND